MKSRFGEMKGEVCAAAATSELGAMRSMPTKCASGVPRASDARSELASAVARASGAWGEVASAVARASGARCDVASAVARASGARSEIASAVARASGAWGEVASAVARASGARSDVASAVARAAAVLLGTAAVLAIAGCASSAPLRFYTLSAVAPAGGEAATGGAIRVGRVRIPAELDRMEIVQRVDANRLSIGELDRWAAPLEDMVRRVLAANLNGPAQGQTPATLNVDIEEFMGDASCNVTLTASWELKDQAPRAPAAPSGGDASSPAGLRTGRETIRVPGGGSACSASSLPMPMSQALAQLSEKIRAAR